MKILLIKLLIRLITGEWSREYDTPDGAYTITVKDIFVEEYCVYPPYDRYRGHCKLLMMVLREEISKPERLKSWTPGSDDLADQYK